MTEGPFVTLHSRSSTLVIELRGPDAPDAAPLWRYWGPRLPAGAVPGWPITGTRPPQPSSFDADRPLSIAPAFGVGWIGGSALLAHRDGLDFTQCFDRCDVHRHDGDHRIDFVLTDTVARLQLCITITIDPARDVFSLRSALTNTGEAPLQVQWLAAGTLPLPSGFDHLRSSAGRWSSEMQPQIERLSRSIWLRENRSGRTSHESFPGAIVGDEGSTRWYGSHLAWSGNHRQVIESLDDGTRQWQMGEWLAPGEVRLAPGHTLQSPELLAACSTDGLDGLAHAFHDALRRRLPWPGGAMHERPVHLNTWEAVYFDHRRDNLESLARAAADLGVERFVLDDGWFHGRSDDRRALGDWWPDEAKYPDGLAPLAGFVNSLGMEFGLWVEPEMVSPDSDLYRAHPDWALQIEGRPLVTFRHQLVLDVARPEVAEHLFALLDARLRETPIAYLKWDMNRDLSTAARAGVPVYREQVHALYALLDRVRQAHPAVEIESCASGGARIDFGVLAHTHRVWTSDCNDALSRVTIQRELLQWFPPEVMGAHMGPHPAHTTGRGQMPAFRCAVALPGHFGVEADPRAMSDAERTELRAWIALHKRLRHLLHTGRVWRGDAGDGIFWQAHGDHAARELVLFVYRIDATRQRHAPLVRLPMLDARKTYRLERVDPMLPAAHSFAVASPLDTAMREGGAAFDGAWLAQAGLPLPRMAAESAVVIRLVAQA